MVSIHMPDLVDLHHHLRRIRRDDQHVRMGLDKNAGFALVGLAQSFPRLHGLSKAGIQIKGFADPAGNSRRLRKNRVTRLFLSG